MKKNWVFVVLLLAASFSEVFGQVTVDVIPFVGYQFGGRLRAYQGEVNLDDNLNYGGSINVNIPGGRIVDFSFSQQQSQTNIVYFPSGITQESFETNINYYMLGMYQGLDQGGPFIPYIGASLGVVSFVPREIQYSNETRMAVGISGGFKYMLSDAIGIRAQVRMLMPVMWAGGGMYCGPGGCATGVSTSSAIIQGDVTGGIVVRVK